MVGNHVADIVGRYGADGAAVPQALSDYIAGRAGLRLQLARQGRQRAHRLRAGRGHRPVLPDRAGRAPGGAARRSCEALGVDQFALYLQHDAKDEHARRVRRARACPQSTPARQPRRDALTWRAPHRDGPGGAGSAADRALARSRSADRRCWSARSGRPTSRGAPADGVKLFGTRILPRTTDAAMPHLSHDLARLRRSRGRRRDHLRPDQDGARLGRRRRAAHAALGGGRLRRSAWSSACCWRCSWTGCAIAERALLPYVVLSQTVPLIALAPLVSKWGQGSQIGSFEWQPWMSVVGDRRLPGVLPGRGRHGARAQVAERGAHRVLPLLGGGLVEDADPAQAAGVGAVPRAGAAAGRGRRGGRQRSSPRSRPGSTAASAG